MYLCGRYGLIFAILAPFPTVSEMTLRTNDGKDCCGRELSRR